MALLEVKNLHKKFDSTEVLKGVDLTVEKGDVVSILGPSGSGKTTLLRCINFLEKADEGELVFGQKTYHLPGIGRDDISAL
ncbi:MAG: amino acid ABC transporter ATP-binding protein, partial [Butyrivibrio sp.]|nr:amino acid ABC transporter ATP-binding protein [Butyrivibrio sp.]